MLLERVAQKINTLFLDMNGTFMFEHDRIGEREDFFPSYQKNGGQTLDHQTLNLLVRRVLSRLNTLYQEGKHDTCFPQVIEIIQTVLENDIEEKEKQLIERVIADHEFGVISEKDKSVLLVLAKHFKLIVVSNLWSKSKRWRDYIHRRLHPDVFSALVFSADIGINKPAHEIFEHALSLAKTTPSEVAMVGDDYDRDIRPTKQLGLTTVWITQSTKRHPDSDYMISSLSDFLTLTP